MGNDLGIPEILYVMDGKIIGEAQSITVAKPYYVTGIEADISFEEGEEDS